MNEATRCQLEKTFVDLIIEELKLYGNNRAWFERETGISEANVRRWEKGGHVLLNTCSAAFDGIASARADQALAKQELTPEEIKQRKQQETINFKDLYVAKLTCDIAGLQEMKGQLKDAKKEIAELKAQLRECKKTAKAAKAG